MNIGIYLGFSTKATVSLTRRRNASQGLCFAELHQCSFVDISGRSLRLQFHLFLPASSRLITERSLHSPFCQLTCWTAGCTNPKWYRSLHAVLPVHIYVTHTRSFAAACKIVLFPIVFYRCRPSSQCRECDHAAEMTCGDVKVPDCVSSSLCAPLPVNYKMRWLLQVLHLARLVYTANCQWCVR